MTQPEKAPNRRQVRFILLWMPWETPKAESPQRTKSAAAVLLCISVWGNGDGGIDARKLTLKAVTFVSSYCYSRGDFRKNFQLMLAEN